MKKTKQKRYLVGGVKRTAEQWKERVANDLDNILEHQELDWYSDDNKYQIGWKLEIYPL